MTEQKEDIPSYHEMCHKCFELFDSFADKNVSFTTGFYKSAEVLPNHPLIKDPKNEIMFRFNVVKGGDQPGGIMTMIDGFTSIAIMAKEDPPFGVSVTVKMFMEKIKELKIGENSYYFCKIDNFGKNLAFCSCRIYNENGEICVTGGQVKMRMDYSKLVGKKNAKL